MAISLTVATRQGFKDFGEGSGISWKVYPRTRGVKAHVEADWGSRDGYEGGPGQSFSRRAVIRVSRSRVLVTQYGGVDI